MESREKRNLWKSLSAIMFAFVLLIIGACCISFDGDEVQAEGTIVMSPDGRYGTILADEVASEGVPTYEGYLFAGWMEQSGDTYKVVSSRSKATHAKFVPEELLTIKAQTTQAVVEEVENSADGNKYAGKYVLRFVSSVESLDYFDVGFEVVDEDKNTYTNTTDDVCYRIDSTTQGAEYTFSPKVMDVESEYFITAKFPVEPDKINDLYTVRAFWTTKDGTRVYGVPRCFAVSDGLKTSTTLNVSFVSDVAVTKEQELSVAYDADNDATTPDVVKTATVIDYDTATKTAHARIAFDSVEDKASLKSVTQFIFSTTGENSISLGSGTYRNLYTKYTETTAGDVTTDTTDTTWYNATDDEFVIATSADLYGFANIVNGIATNITADSFENKKIYVVSDIEVNKGRATSDGWKLTDADGNNIEGATDYPWTAIGYQDSYPFKGTFDGQGHEISGLYLPQSNSQDYNGLFGWAGYVSEIKYISIKNSYFEHSSGLIGSIAGRGDGNLDTIHSEVTISSSADVCGGIVGRRQGTNKDISYKNCWYSGTMLLQGQYGGGILGQIRRGDLLMDNCLFSGTVIIGGEQESKYIGGLVGQARRLSSGTTDFTIQDCLNSGVFQLEEGMIDDDTIKDVRRIIGSVTTNASNCFVTVKNTYYTTEGYKKDYSYYDTTTATEKTDGTFAFSKNNIVGNLSYFNTTLDFVNAWALVEGGTPILKCFADEIQKLPVVPDNADITWYTGPNDYIICDNEDNASNVAELYGFSYLVNQGVIFDGKTVSMGSDVTINAGDRKTWNVSTGEGLISWTSVGTEKTPFAGTFDGNYHSISGVYMDVDQNGAGLFAATAAGSTIKNLKLENSYFKNVTTVTTRSGYSYTGSIVGECAGNLENVYSNAYVEAKVYSGGLIGDIPADSNVSITRCWFDGDMKAQGNNQGGIVGHVSSDAIITITDCLNTGDITAASSTRKWIGGICGRIQTTSFTMERCLNYGTLPKNNGGNVGSIVGQCGSTTSGTINKVYATNEGYTGTESTSNTNYICVIKVSEEVIDENQLETWEFDTTIWALAEDGTPALIMTAPITE